MSLRAKLLVAVALLAVVPTTAAGVYNYLAGRRAVEGLLRAGVRSRADAAAQRATATLRAHEAQLTHLAGLPALRKYVLDSAAAAPGAVEPPEELRAAVAALFVGSGRLEAVSCLDERGRPLFRASAPTASAGPNFQTKDFVTTTFHFDERVWSRATAHEEPLRSSAREPYGSGLRSTVPVFGRDDVPTRPVGALVLKTRLTTLLKDTDEEGAAVETAGASASTPTPAAPAQVATTRVLFAVDTDSGRVVYHTDDLLTGQAASEAVPHFESLKREASAGGSAATTSYETPGGERWLAAVARPAVLGVELVAAENYTRAAAAPRRAALFGIILPLLAGAAALALVFVLTTRAKRRIERVAEGAAAVAGGDLERRVEVDSSGATRVLAEGFNLMTERLREHLRREAETRQFESFMRLSAMLTHDLKNSITGLSMLVSNMERFYDHEGFRADAVSSLRDATDKLRRIVSRLSEPVKSLSGEYRRDARPTDLVAVIRRVLAAHAEPSAPLYVIERRLPEELIATIDAERVENVVENLVVNALEAMGARGGRLTVEAGALDGGLVFFSVADTGAGMSEEFIRTRLFRPFSTTKEKGIGLGLYTCREVVETHGGRLEVESNVGAGTRFRVVLPSALFAARTHSGQAGRRTAAPAETPPGERRDARHPPSSDRLSENNNPTGPTE